MVRHILGAATPQALHCSHGERWLPVLRGVGPLLDITWQGLGIESGCACASFGDFSYDTRVNPSLSEQRGHMEDIQEAARERGLIHEVTERDLWSSLPPHRRETEAQERPLSFLRRLKISGRAEKDSVLHDAHLVFPPELALTTLHTEHLLLFSPSSVKATPRKRKKALSQRGGMESPNVPGLLEDSISREVSPLVTTPASLYPHLASIKDSATQEKVEGGAEGGSVTGGLCPSRRRSTGTGPGGPTPCPQTQIL